jgi:hypothetical protein
MGKKYAFQFQGNSQEHLLLNNVHETEYSIARGVGKEVLSPILSQGLIFVRLEMQLFLKANSHFLESGVRLLK